MTKATCIIVGKTLNPADYPELQGRIGPDETAIEVSADELKRAVVWRVTDEEDISPISDGNRVLLKNQTNAPDGVYEFGPAHKRAGEPLKNTE